MTDPLHTDPGAAAQNGEIAASASNKAPGDTAQGCRERAASDIACSIEIGTANQRLRLEHSAASWLVRADMIERFNDSAAARKAAAVAMWAEDDAPLLRHPPKPRTPDEGPGR